MITIKKKIKRIISLTPMMTLCMSINDLEKLRESLDNSFDETCIDLAKQILGKEMDHMTDTEFFELVYSNSSNFCANINMEKIQDNLALKGEKFALKELGLYALNHTSVFNNDLS